MPKSRTAGSSTATKASARCSGSPGRRSCSSPAPASFWWDPGPWRVLWPSWPRPCWAPRSARWRSSTTLKKVQNLACFKWHRCMETSGWSQELLEGIESFHGGEIVGLKMFPMIIIELRFRTLITDINYVWFIVKFPTGSRSAKVELIKYLKTTWLSIFLLLFFIWTTFLVF